MVQSWMQELLCIGGFFGVVSSLIGWLLWGFCSGFCLFGAFLFVWGSFFGFGAFYSDTLASPFIHSTNCRE